MESPANATLLNVGTKCKADHCGLYDFLPYKCQFCLESYCSDHFRPAAHHCVKYTSTDRVAPPCPLCQTPVSIKPNEDPNDAMEAHFTTSCAVMLGNDAAAKSKSKTPRCSKNRCEKVLYTPITCDFCRKQFCATHRHPDTHKCASADVPAASPSSTRIKPREDLSDRLRSGLRLGSPSNPPPPKSSKPVSSLSTTSRPTPTSSKPVSSPSNTSRPTPTSNKPVSSPLNTNRPTPAPAPAARRPSVSPTRAKSLQAPAPEPAPAPAPAPAPGASAGAGGSGSSKSPGHNPFSKVDRWVSFSLPSTPGSPVSSISTPSLSSSPLPVPQTHGVTPLQAIVESNAEKPKPHLLLSSFVPPSLFGTA